jgi:serine/threonine protein kinase
MSTEQAAVRVSGSVLRGFEDGLGRRYSPVARGDNDASLEILCFRHEITDVPSFDFALRERVARLSSFEHPYYARIRKVDRLNDERATVALMSDAAPGIRLIEMLGEVERGGLVLDLNASLYLLRQLLSAISVLHEHARVAHGAIAPERLFITPLGRLCVVEYVMGAALEQLKYSRERYWKELRVALPMTVGLPRFDERTDLTQIGVVALALTIGRPLQDDEYPARIEELVASACSRTADGSTEPLTSGLREWLRRALQLDVRSSFRTLSEALAAFDQALSEDAKLSADAGALEAFLERYHNPSKAPVPAPKPVLVADSPIVRSEPEPRNDNQSFVDSAWEEPISLVEPSDESRTETDDEEQDDLMKTTYGKRSFGRSKTKWIAAGVIAAIATTAALYAARGRFSPATVPVTTGSMTVNTNPPGAMVEVDGTPRGQTPITLSLTAGEHTLVVNGGGEPRTIPITIAAGAQLSQYIELPKVAAAGQLTVRTEPAGARISVDGLPLGKTPVTVELAPGQHSVTLESDMGSVTQTVTIEAGVPASLVVPLGATPGAVLSGWVSVNSPVVLELYEQGRLLGTSGIDRIMLPAGKHEIELASATLGFRDTRTIQVAGGRVSAINVTLPKGSMSLNAVPWATVSVDGENIGDTPIGNFPITIGPHEVVFRNPQLGEQRRVITVTLQSPVRLSVDMAKK